MFRFCLFCALCTFVAGLVGCQKGVMNDSSANTSSDNVPAAKKVAMSAEDVDPVKTGDRAPSATLSRLDGTSVSLGELYADKSLMMVFYRGGWCPYCNTHLMEVGQVEPELTEMGFDVVAISPDRPAKLNESMEKGEFKYELLSDADMSLSKAFGLAFRVDDATIGKYKDYGIDLEDASGHDHYLLPVPAVYIIDTKGTIQFAHWNPDYKNRIDNEALLSAAREAKDTTTSAR